MELEWKDWGVEASRASKAHDHHRAYQLSSIGSGRLQQRVVSGRRGLAFKTHGSAQEARENGQEMQGAAPV